MSIKRANSDKGKDNIAGPKMPSIESTLQIKPQSHVAFKSRWSLSQDALDAGLQAAAQKNAKANLVLRAYSLRADSSASDFSEIWQDFTLNGLKGSRCFTLPKPTPKVRGVIGLINNSGQFSPLIRGMAVALPPPPDQLAAQGRTGMHRNSLISEADEPESSLSNPAIGKIDYHSPPSHALTNKTNTAQRASQSVEELFVTDNETSTENAPLELRAEFVIFGKIAPGTKLLMGGHLIKAATDGTVEWKQKIGSFKQVWPLLQEALKTPSVDAGPSLEFFQKIGSKQKQIELRAALKITGKVNNAEYLSMLPEALNIDANGVFQVSRMLPNGAVILPGFSLIAEK